MKRLFAIMVFLVMQLGICHAVAESTSTETYVVNGVEYKKVQVDKSGFVIPIPVENLDNADRPLVICNRSDMGAGFAPGEEYTVIYGNVTRGVYISCHSGNLRPSMNTEKVTEKDIKESEYIKRAYSCSWEQGVLYSEVVEDCIVLVDGHPARLEIIHAKNYKNEDFCLGSIKYNRDNEGFVVEIFCEESPSWETADKVSMEELKGIADLVSYNRKNATGSWIVFAEDGELSLTTKNQVTSLVAGKSLPLLISYADQKKAAGLVKDFMRSEKNVPEIRWTITDAATGEQPDGVSITDKGVLSAEKTISKPCTVEIKADSSVFLTTASCQITIVPVASSISAEPSELILYEGQTDGIPLKAIIEPEYSPIMGIEWKAAKQGIIEIKDNKDGSAHIVPIKAGNTTITVSEPSGKKTTVKAIVYTPIQEMELKLAGTCKPGNTVSIGVTFTPSKSINKDLEWTVDVDEDIATINNGKVKIAKSAPVGTVITVYCKAQTGREPLVKTIQITVQDK